MPELRKIPVGIEDFCEIRTKDAYYIDKTKLIEQLLESWSKVNLFTRPRRFGKTLNMSMLKNFFEIGADKALFDGLYIAQNKTLCEQHLGKYPVIFISLKDVAGLTFKEAVDMLVQLIGREAKRFSFLQNSSRLSADEQDQYKSLIAIKNGKHWMDKGLLASSLIILSQLLYQHYDQKVIILIDEYDVPLDKAFQNGYYREMVSLIRSLFGQALKTNSFLQFAALTGCLCVSKESIFTGLNNFKVHSVEDVRYDEEFGFTDNEVQQLLVDYGLSDHFQEAKEWYDGYKFGNADIYCPWDVMNYVDDLQDNPKLLPKSYWINSSGNDLLKRFIDKADSTTRDEIEQLIAGSAVSKQIRLDLTYDEIDRSIDNIWSVLFTTGYLTQTGVSADGMYQLVIPNKEIREVFVLKIQEWFKNVVDSNQSSTEKINQGFLAGNSEVIQQELTMFLTETISILDTKARERQKENFYHGILLGILKNHSGWAVKSNRESGDGFADIMIKPRDPDTGIIIEVKYAHSFNDLEQACERALKQVYDRRYDETFQEDGRSQLLAYGIAFYKKRCRVMVEKI